MALSPTLINIDIAYTFHQLYLLPCSQNDCVTYKWEQGNRTWHTAQLTTWNQFDNENSPWHYDLTSSGTWLVTLNHLEIYCYTNWKWIYVNVRIGSDSVLWLWNRSVRGGTSVLFPGVFIQSFRTPCLCTLLGLFTSCIPITFWMIDGDHHVQHIF